MKKHLISVLHFSFIALVLGSLVSFVCADSGTEYPDGHGGSVFFPLGDVSFADEVVSFEIGDPQAAEKDSLPEETLGAPDYDASTEDNYTTLGCGGTLTLRFSDNALVDLEGPDLHVFEIGPAVEPTDLSISKDGKTWINIGKIEGGRADVDIASFVKPGDIFYYVRLTDLKSACGNSKWPGADIDSVGAIGSGLLISLEGSVLFDFDKFKLKTEARVRLLKVADKIKSMSVSRVVIEGHTDSVGSNAYNQSLSAKRAMAVRDFFKALKGLSGLEISTEGYGESRPLADNESDEGRAKNRRVGIVVIPSK